LGPYRLQELRVHEVVHQGTGGAETGQASLRKRGQQQVPVATALQDAAHRLSK
jgi:molybdenum-dependent DNA-binding transcriptional regulator ModE